MKRGAAAKEHLEQAHVARDSGSMEIGRLKLAPQHEVESHLNVG